MSRLRVRRLIALGVNPLVAAVITACNQTPPSPPADLAAPSGVALSGRTVAVASTESDELKILDISASPTVVFLQAPDPLYPLSVPVGPRPTQLAGDNYVGGQRSPSPYIFSLSVQDQSITVVASGVNQLVPLTTIQFGGTPLAIAARGFVLNASNTVTLYVALQEGSLAVLRRLDIPASGPLDPSKIASPIVAVLPGSYPQSVDVSCAAGCGLPGFDRVAVGLREPSDGVSGAVLVNHADTNAVTLSPIAAGGPIRTVAFTSDGSRLYLLYDSDGCPIGDNCHGLTFVTVPALSDTPSGVAVPVLIPGSPLDMSIGGGVCFNLGLVTVPTNLQCCSGNPFAQAFGVVVLVGSSDGNIYVVDGDLHQLINSDVACSTVLAPSVLVGSTFVPEPANSTLCQNAQINCANANDDPTEADCQTLASSVCSDPNGPQPIALSQGLVRTEHIFELFEGPIEPLNTRPATFEGTAIVDPNVDYAALGVEPGDIVTIENGTCSTTEGSVTSIAPGRLDVTGIDAACVPANPTYSVRPANAYAVTGVSADPPFVLPPSGYLGRAVPNKFFPLAGEVVRPQAFAGAGFATPVVIPAGGLKRQGGNVTATLPSGASFMPNQSAIQLTTSEADFPGGGKIVTVTGSTFSYVEAGPDAVSQAAETFVAVPVVFLMGNGPGNGTAKVVRGEGYYFQVDGAFQPYALPVNAVTGGISFDPLTTSFFVSLTATNYACQLTPLTLGVSGGVITVGETCLQ
jgi:hypothetical protein